MVFSNATTATRRDDWADACGAAALVSLLVIACHVVLPAVSGLAIPYSGGAAVILGLGAVLGSAITVRVHRLLAASTLVALLLFRLVTALWPDMFTSAHGSLTPSDGAALFALILVAAAVCVVAARPPSRD